MIFSYQEEINGIIVKDTSGLHPSEVTINYEGSSEGHRSENVLAPAARNIKLLFHINKYANANFIKIDIKKENDDLILMISDNGIGFNVKTAKKGIGLQNILFRANECEGTVDIKSNKGEGTIITLKVPTKK